ncbi:MAG: diadenosine tetraphosphate hydrolase [Gammaproteobacteria bacterium]|nr:MAG: diadenosine tetraphosphate hydrolase [Gammaproteobacteria bacterium]
MNLRETGKTLTDDEARLNMRLLADSLPVIATPCSFMRLFNDSRWPWLMLMPRVFPAVAELHELDETTRAGFLADVNTVSSILKAATACRSVNIAMLGNVVPDLHCHVVARHEDDPVWPAPVWGHGEAMPYNDANYPAPLVDRLRREISS